MNKRVKVLATIVLVVLGIFGVIAAYPTLSKISQENRQVHTKEFELQDIKIQIIPKTNQWGGVIGNEKHIVFAYVDDNNKLITREIQFNEGIQIEILKNDDINISKLKVYYNLHYGSEIVYIKYEFYLSQSTMLDLY